ncbi:helix-turn-helix domain-containing protein [Streptococcus urinalis]|uniref:PucR C-terminal helix-turn-helix domain-containing protein n=1 Tax=Streptococcus urinalis 2285-97 TaxID=764291 RepID=G5KCA5_9STRE|nr:hypothetical protein STRUR_0419 [Streptococcus urinalis 2285-97]
MNTFRARLAKIEAILSISLKNTDHLMNIHLALRLHQNKMANKNHVYNHKK